MEEQEQNERNKMERRKHQRQCRCESEIKGRERSTHGGEQAIHKLERGSLGIGSFGVEEIMNER